MDRFDDEKSMLLTDLYRVTSTERKAILWAQDHDLLWQFPQCDSCGELLNYDEHCKRFRCRRIDCSNTTYLPLRKIPVANTE